jgi:hypothetical protein
MIIPNERPLFRASSFVLHVTHTHTFLPKSKSSMFKQSLYWSGYHLLESTPLHSYRTDDVVMVVVVRSLLHYLAYETKCLQRLKWPHVKDFLSNQTCDKG